MVNKRRPQTNVLMVGSELTPLAKAGGLGDVLGALPKALVPYVHSVAVALPFHQEIHTYNPRPLKKFLTVNVSVGKTSVPVTIWQTVIPGTKIPVFLFHNTKYLSRGRVYQGDAVYDPTKKGKATSKAGQALRYLVFSFAVHQFIKHSNLGINVVHGHDYHSGATLALVHTDSSLQHVGRVLTLHNLGVVGATEKKYLHLFNWDPVKLFGKAEFNRTHGARLVKLGINHAQVITTVSKQYAKEILTPAYGNSLETVLRKRRNDLVGIVNGIDMDSFNPQTDSNVPYQYSFSTIARKQKNKTALQKTAGLPVDPTIPVIGLVSRLTSQKGLELIVDLLPRLGSLRAQFIFTGTGQPEYTNAFEAAQRMYPKQFYFHHKFDIPFSQQVYGGSDIFLMPSKFEPCGLGQIIAMRYGSVPVVRATGGLKDTVHNSKNGFVFTQYSSAALWRTLRQAVTQYTEHPNRWTKLVRAGMLADYSWKNSAKKYVAIYNKLTS